MPASPAAPSRALALTPAGLLRWGPWLCGVSPHWLCWLLEGSSRGPRPPLPAVLRPHPPRRLGRGRLAAAVPARSERLAKSWLVNPPRRVRGPRLSGEGGGPCAVTGPPGGERLEAPPRPRLQGRRRWGAGERGAAVRLPAAQLCPPPGHRPRAPSPRRRPRQLCASLAVALWLQESAAGTPAEGGRPGGSLPRPLPGWPSGRLGTGPVSRVHGEGAGGAGRREGPTSLRGRRWAGSAWLWVEARC